MVTKSIMVYWSQKVSNARKIASRYIKIIKIPAISDWMSKQKHYSRIESKLKAYMFLKLKLIKKMAFIKTVLK